MIRILTSLALVFLALPALAAVPIQKVVSPGGIEAWLVEEDTIPIISIGIEFRVAPHWTRRGARASPIFSQDCLRKVPVI